MGYKADATGEWKIPDWAALPAPAIELASGETA